jgi:type I restriction enzyme S subunit
MTELALNSDMNRGVVAVDLPDGWSLVTFDHALTVQPITDMKVKERDYLPEGQIAVVDQGQKLIGGYTNDLSKVVGGAPPVIVFGDHTRALKFVNFEFAAGADGVKVLRTSSLFDPKLLFYFLHCIELPDKGYARHFQFLRKSQIPLPPHNEQHRIVAKIEELLTQLDAGVASLKRIQASLQRYKAAVLKAACEGKLVSQDPSDEPASVLLERILAERRARWEEEQRAKGKDPRKVKYDEPAPPDTEGLPELPEGWVWASIEQLAAHEARSIQSGPFGSALLHSEFQESGVLAIGIDNVQEGWFSIGSEHRISLEKYEQLKKYTARPLDVLITVMATVGRVCVVPTDLEPAIITKHVYRISTNQAFVNPKYLMLSLWGGATVRKQLFGQVQGQTRPGINGEILRRLAIPVPPLVEQNRIVAEVERRLSLVQALEPVLKNNLMRAERLRQAILRQAFEGKLVPQDPSDEPASVLLERIRTERDAEKGVSIQSVRRTSNITGIQASVDATPGRFEQCSFLLND